MGFYEVRIICVTLYVPTQTFKFYFHCPVFQNREILLQLFTVSFLFFRFSSYTYTEKYVPYKITVKFNWIKTILCLYCKP